MFDAIIDVCAVENCRNPSVMECICLNQAKSYCRNHLTEHIKIPHLNHKTQRLTSHDQKIGQEKIEDLNKVLSDLTTISETFTTKIEGLLKLKSAEFYSKIEKNIDITKKYIEFLMENDYKNSSESKFEAKFEKSYKQSLKMIQEEVLIANRYVDDIKDISIMTSDDLWISQVYNEIKNSDYKHLCMESSQLNIDYLYSETTLKFLNSIQSLKDCEYDLCNRLTDHYFNKTDLCNKENILSNIAKELSKENQELLYNIVRLSKSYMSITQSASNAFSILVKSNFSFTFADFVGIKIHNANLSRKVFYKTIFRNAILSNCNLLKSQFINCFVDGLGLTMDSQPSSSKSISIDCVSISHNESWVAASKIRKIFIYPLNSSKNRIKLSHDDISCSAHCISWSYDDKYLVSGHFEGHMLIWDPLNPENPMRLLKHHIQKIYSISWSPNDYKIVTGSGYQDIKIWDKENSQELYYKNLTGGWILTLLWSQSKNYICYLLGNGVIQILDANKHVEIWECMSKDIRCLDWINYDNFIAFGEANSIKIWNYNKNSLCKCSEVLLPSNIRSMKWLNHWLLIAVGLVDGSIHIFSAIESEEGDDFEIKKLLKFVGHGNEITSLSWSDKGSVLASGSYDGTVKLWKLHRKYDLYADQDSEETKSLALTIDQDIDYEDAATLKETCFLATPDGYYEELLWSSVPRFFNNNSKK